jgi:hypothetical protein
MFVKRRRWRLESGCGLDFPVEAPSQCAFDRASDVAVCFAFGGEQGDEPGVVGWPLARAQTWDHDRALGPTSLGRNARNEKPPYCAALMRGRVSWVRPH